MLTLSIGESKIEGFIRYFEWEIRKIDEKTEKSRHDIVMHGVYVERLDAAKVELKEVREGTASL